MGEEKKLLSVIVPSYDMEAFLPKCLGSMVAADAALLRKLDVVVVNDGSKDRTSEIAHDFERRYPGVIRVIDKPNGHYGSCINAALPAVKGEFVRILDADDYVNSDEWARYLRFLDEVVRPDPRADLLFADFQQVDPAGAVVKLEHFAFPEGRTFDLNEIVGRRGFLGIHAITYRTSVFDGLDYRQSEGVMYSDTEWFVIPTLAVRGARYLPAVVTDYLVGRVGQTMEEATFDRNFHVVADRVLRVVSELRRLRDRILPQSARFVEWRLHALVSWPYSKKLWSARRARCQVDLASYDDRLREADPAIHVAAGYYRAPFWMFRYPYVRGWRRGRAEGRATLPFRLFSAYAAAIGFFSIALGIEK